VKHLILLIFLALIGGFSCEPALEDPFERVTIPKGSHSAFQKAQLLQSRTFKFVAVFDHTAIYESSSEENQHDANKLLGFSDCNSHHHQNSARFGWRWLDDKLEILAYSYANGERFIEPIIEVGLNEPHEYKIQIRKDHYEFSVDGVVLSKMERYQRCNVGVYYMLFPYFGGDDKAPHDITIQFQILY